MNSHWGGDTGVPPGIFLKSFQPLTRRPHQTQGVVDHYLVGWNEWLDGVDRGGGEAKARDRPPDRLLLAPLRFPKLLTLGTVPISAGIVGDWQCATRVTLINIPTSRLAGGQRGHHSRLLSRHRIPWPIFSPYSRHPLAALYWD